MQVLLSVLCWIKTLDTKRSARRAFASLGRASASSVISSTFVSKILSEGRQLTSEPDPKHGKLGMGFGGRAWAGSNPLAQLYHCTAYGLRLGLSDMWK